MVLSTLEYFHISIRINEDPFYTFVLHVDTLIQGLTW